MADGEWPIANGEPEELRRGAKCQVIGDDTSDPNFGRIDRKCEKPRDSPVEAGLGASYFTREALE